MLAIVGLTAFLGDYASAAGIPTIVVQGIYWDMTPNQVNYAGNLNVIMLYASFLSLIASTAELAADCQAEESEA